jgi:F420-dependent oxidoreductase-like protein
MRLVVFTEPQLGAAHDDLLRIAQHAEALGFDGFFRSDHFLTMGRASGLPGPSDSWASLAALAVQTSRVRLGTLVSSATFRQPGLLAVTVAQVDQMSGGRIELGLGTGWYAAEHTAYGVPFPSTKERFERLGEQLEIITGLWATPVGERFTFKGKHYELSDAPGLPKPVQTPGPPVIVGGVGRRVTPRLAARFAAEYNVAFRSLEATREAYDRAAEACAELGRDEGSVPLARSVAQTVVCGRDDAEVRRRAVAIGQSPEQVDIAGTPDQIVETVARFGELGASRFYMQILDLSDLDHLDLIAERVAPQLR